MQNETERKGIQKAHKKLRVWMSSMDLTQSVYETTSASLEREHVSLFSHMRRTALSVPCNIAEGAARYSDKESLQFYGIARGSLSELDTQIELCQRLQLLSQQQIAMLSERLCAVDSLLSGLIRSIKNPKPRSQGQREEHR
jgi:four helix bundle protein